jgi:hypothetical protein
VRIGVSSLHEQKEKACSVKNVGFAFGMGAMELALSLRDNDVRNVFSGDGSSGSETELVKIQSVE